MKINKQLIKIINWFILGIIFSVFSHFLIELFHFGFEFGYVIEQNLSVRPILFLLGSIILFIFYVLFSSISGSSLIGGFLLLSGITGVSTNLKSLHRAEPLSPSDLYWVRELPFLFKMIGRRNAIIIMALIIVTIIVLILL